MFCRGCGKELLKGSRFCVNCGQEADFFVDENTTKDNNTSKVGNVVETGIPERAPKQMRRMVGVQSYAPKPLSKGMIIGIVAGGVATVVITIVVIAVVIAGRHDLEGTYSYGGRFPITTITFSKDGTFTARCDYSEYSTGAIYYGEYYKDGDTYEIRFTDAKSNTNNTVVIFRIGLMD